MIALLQRVQSASVQVEGLCCAQIEHGLLVFFCAEPRDVEYPQLSVTLERFIERLLNYRVFPDNNGKMNLSVRTSNGSVLFVPQFTLAADTRSGLRPGFSTAAAPEFAQQLFNDAWHLLHTRHASSACGIFGADMKVSLINDGPASFWLES